MSFDNLLLPLVALLLTLVLLRSHYSHGRLWQATITPLASIIGSGFLIVAPLLAKIGGSAATWLMLLIVLFAYLIGSIIRFNICHAEPKLEQNQTFGLVSGIERVSNIALSVAYIISITFYLRLLSSFVLEMFAARDPLFGQWLTTGIFLLIGITGWRWGLHALEKLENISVTIKLAIIASLLLALFHYDLLHGFGNGLLEAEQLSMLDRIRMLGGMLLVVQGFETSRYLGREYSREMRIQSMKLAQWLSAGIYLLFVFLVTPLMHLLNYDQITETAIITLSSYVLFVLPFMLVIAATMSQFSAAVGDTIGSGGLIEEESRRLVPEQVAYLLISGFGILLVWFADIFEIVALASRAFAFYYLLQTLLALRLSGELKPGRRRVIWQAILIVVSVVLAAVVLFAIPVG